jgi:hypothetical protein
MYSSLYLPRSRQGGILTRGMAWVGVGAKAESGKFEVIFAGTAETPENAALLSLLFVFAFPAARRRKPNSGYGL